MNRRLLTPALAPFLAALLLASGVPRAAGDPLDAEVGALLAARRAPEALARLLAAPERVIAAPDTLGRRLFEFRDAELLAATGAAAKRAAILERIAANAPDEAARLCAAAVDAHPLAWPLRDLLASLYLAGAPSAADALLPRLAAPMRRLHEAALAAEAGRIAESRRHIDDLLAAHRDFMPLYRTLGLLPPTVVNPGEKAEAGRRWLREGMKAPHATLDALLAENALVSALDAAAACRRLRQELSAEAGMLFDDRGNLRGDLAPERRERIRCPVGLPYRVEAAGGAPGFACPLHGR